MKHTFRWQIRLAFLFLGSSAGWAADLQPQILERLPHDSTAFTQGLLIDDGVWLEGTGRYGRSDLREVERATGRVLRRLRMPGSWFGEGIALLNGKIYQLTWRSGIGRVVDRETFEEIGTFRYPGEGWGLTTDGKRLYLSDGSPVIRILDPETLKEADRFEVTENGRPVKDLNELEWIEGEIWANIWQTRRIVRIDPETGKVIGGLVFPHLPLPEDRWPGQDVLNGIAVDPQTGDIWITGKLWKALYRIEWPVGSAETSRQDAKTQR